MPEFTRSMVTPSLAARFWTKVDTSGGPQACWPWLGSRTVEFTAPNGPHGGYGRLRVRSGDGIWYVEYTHRIVFVMFNEEPLGDGWILHDCDNPRCCNPMHIYLGDPKQNAQDREKRQRSRALTADQQAEICQSYLHGDSYRDISARFGVNGSTVTHVLRKHGVTPMRQPMSGRRRRR